MRHTLIRRFTTETHKLRRKDADGEDQDERLVPLGGPLAAADCQTDALQHTQEKRAASGQEDLGILEPMRLPNGSLIYPKSLGLSFGLSVPPTNPGQRFSAFPAHLDNLSQPPQPFHLIWTVSLSLSLPPSPHHDLAWGKSTRFHSSFWICMDRMGGFGRKGRRVATQSCIYTASQLGAHQRRFSEAFS